MLELKNEARRDPEACRVLDDVLNAVINHKGVEARPLLREISDVLLSDECVRTIPRGTRSTRITGVQDEVLGTIAADPRFRHLREDATFLIFARRMCAIAARNLSWTRADLLQNPQRVETLVEHLEAHYSLLVEARVPRSVLNTHAHKFSLWEIGTVLSDAQRIFGADPDTESLARTAAFKVFTKHYTSIAEAKRSYDSALNDARRIFGADAESETLIRTAAFQTFAMRFKSVDHAKQFYDSALTTARDLFGADAESEGLVRTAAFLVFVRRYKSVADAKRAYDSAFDDACRIFGTDADSESLVRTAACRVFLKKYASVREAKEHYDQFRVL